MSLAATLLLMGALADPTAALRPLVGIPYVVDAGEDERGRFVLISHPERALPRPGLNCSGFVVAACRRLLGYRGTLVEAGVDRRGDSGPSAALRQDWDFGLDLILNLSEGQSRHRFGIDITDALPDQDGRSLRGFRLDTPRLWERLLPRLRGDAVYLGSLSRVKHGRLSHHHVALLLKDEAGRSWFYHTLPRSCVHRIALDAPQGRQRLLQMFGPAQHLLLVEVAR